MAIVALINTPDPERWRDAEWPRDAASPPKEARFSDNLTGWDLGPLVGHHNDIWTTFGGREYYYCQVRDE